MGKQVFILYFKTKGSVIVGKPHLFIISAPNYLLLIEIFFYKIFKSKIISFEQ